MRSRLRYPLLAGLIVLLALLPRLSSKASTPALQTETTPTPQVETAPSSLAVSLIPVSNETCLSCHGKPGLSLTLENGEDLELFVSPEMYAESIHGAKRYACVQCHTTVGNYPHQPFSAQDARDASLQLYEACKRCHSSQYEHTLDSVHERALESGNLQAAICTDCHSAHAVRQLTDPDTGELLPEIHTWIPQTCARCHNAIYQKYLTSVHGSALVSESNSDVPTCIDCHGVHSIEDPTTTAFRLNSPEMCADCHTNPELMNQYGISTQVLRTYVADFHGTTVTLFEKQHPEAETNKPVCYDCHGVHDIKRPDDPEKGLHVRANLLARCQACHPDATFNFPDAWLSHYIPSIEKTPLIFSVNLFYAILIPAVLGMMALLVALDFSWSVRIRLRRKKKAITATPSESVMAASTAEPSSSGADEMPATAEPDIPPAETVPEEMDSPPLITPPLEDDLEDREEDDHG